ncbi:hypothetical protein C900_01150 [Fulvivirga imtechensis AK7]|uniref:histidine kinase n=1 Tax=Fulvivirga imtechensis AK7 TaxID=1237149 RepID=L8JUW1_9BACT|nr:tetratricopeptide repeat-containing sensor histidine kinase [Fulvivirga imtechensis]ELR72771.1 hypothetical protein C900_01150 [Fulvivirga imtechensis AK7]
MNAYKVIRLALFFILLSEFVQAQSDSFPAAFEELKHGSQKNIRAYFDSLRNISSNDKESIHLSLLSYGHTHDRPFIEALALRNLGHIYWEKNEPVRSVTNLRQASEIANDLKDIELESEILMDLAEIFNVHGGEEKAMEYYLKAYPLLLQTDKMRAARAQNAMATLSYGVGNIKACIKYCQAGMTLFESQPIDALNKVDQKVYMQLLNTLGIAYRETNNYDSAIHYLNASKDLASAIDDEFWKTLTLGNMGIIYTRTGDYAKALPLMEQDMVISKKFNEWLSASSAAVVIGNIHREMGSLDAAKIYYDSAMIIAKANNLVPRIAPIYHNNLAKWYALKNDFQHAFYHQEKYTYLKDSAQNKNQQVELSRIKATYDFDSKLSQIDLLTRNNELQRQKIEYRNIIITASISSSLVIFIIALLLYKNLNARKKDNELLSAQKARIESQSKQLADQNRIIQANNDNLEIEVSKRTRKMEQLNRELDTFLYRASHDIRQPIATILGLENLARWYAKDNHLSEILLRVNSTAMSMDNMLRKLQMSYEVNRQPEKLISLEVRDLIFQVVAANQGEINLRKINLQFDVKAQYINSNRELLKIIVQNILENAILYSNEATPEIHITGAPASDEYIIKITDNGDGIPKEYIPSIFNAFFKSNIKSKGNGLGLYLALKAANILETKIEVHSEPAKGSQFVLHIPI